MRIKGILDICNFMWRLKEENYGGVCWQKDYTRFCPFALIKKDCKLYMDGYAEIAHSIIITSSSFSTSHHTKPRTQTDKCIHQQQKNNNKSIIHILLPATQKYYMLLSAFSAAFSITKATACFMYCLNEM